MFQFDPSLLPSLRTRKALLIIDLQNDFASPDGALPVTEPKGYVRRTLDVANAFRASGDGDIIWVRSEYECPRPVEDGCVLIGETPPLLASMRNNRLQRLDVDRSEEDEETFLSGSEDSSKPACVRQGTEGAKLVPEAAAAVDSRDSTLLKTHYSAFASGQLLTLLRTRFATELYVCGALTNVSIHATALDAASHGFAMTLIDDCCGYRSATRHANAVRNLMQLTGCETATAQEMLAQFVPKAKPGPVRTPKAGESSSRHSSPRDKLVRSRKGQAEGPKTSPSPSPGPSTNSLQEALSELRLSDAPTHSADVESEALRPKETEQSVQSVVSKQAEEEDDDDDDDKMPRNPSSAHSKEETDEPLTPKAGSNKHPSLSSPGAAKSQQESELQRPEHAPGDESGLTGNGLPTQTLGPLCSGDTIIIYNALPATLADGIFERLRSEVGWLRMSHQGGEVPRLVCVQGTVSAHDGSQPVYRHPADEAPPLVPFTPTVLEIKAEVEKHLGHPVNHTLIQLYRSGQDHISEHSDKTLDIVKASYIANVSLGAERTMVFRAKRGKKRDDKREIVKAKLPDNSMVKMGLETNAKWTHAIKQDRRADRDKSPAELSHQGARISLTFRNIGTFMNKDGTKIWGQGATAKTKEDAKPVDSDRADEAERMIRAFGIENSTPDFDWDKTYGEGFDVLHVKTLGRLWAGGDGTRNLAVKLALTAFGVAFAPGQSQSQSQSQSQDQDQDEERHDDAADEIRFVDNDRDKSDVRGDVAIMLYLESTYGKQSVAMMGGLAARLTCFQRALKLPSRGEEEARAAAAALTSLAADLGVFEQHLTVPGRYIAGGEAPSIADFTLWPALHAMNGASGGLVDALTARRLTRLAEYYERLGKEGFVKMALDQ